MICEKCKKTYETPYASGRFCCKKCASSRVQSEETKKKLSKSMKRRIKEFGKFGALLRSKKVLNLICENCGKSFTHFEFKKTCSPSCRSVISRKVTLERNPNFYEKISAKAIKNWKDGIYKEIMEKRFAETKEKTCPICGKKFPVRPCELKRIFCSRACLHKDTKLEFHKVGMGGYRKGAGRSKSGYYKGIWCDSQWELAYLIYCLDHNIEIKRNLQLFNYLFEGETHKYLPDFIVNGEYVEIKGFFQKRVAAKSDSVAKAGFKINVLYKKDLKKEFEYLFEKYGIRIDMAYTLYDEHKPSYNYVCDFCGKAFDTEKVRKKETKFCCQRCAGLYRKELRKKISATMV